MLQLAMEAEQDAVKAVARKEVWDAQVESQRRAVMRGGDFLKRFLSEQNMADCLEGFQETLRWVLIQQERFQRTSCCKDVRRSSG